MTDTPRYCSNAGTTAVHPASIAEGAEILRGLIDSIERNGNYTEESTITFLQQALQCIAPPSGVHEEPHGCDPAFIDREWRPLVAKLRADLADAYLGITPPGYCLVPNTLTDAMLAAMCKPVTPPLYRDPRVERDLEYFRELWRAALNAAPTPGEQGDAP